ncbi:lipocalin family protein [Burkholderia plantarii]|uniref:lipocalin family protein n=1 Tax=Burkholderia plantarii TaxID=41899 RepID=UPI002729A630|nr:lipocalin family protein [Burkholderia plantarii]WLE59321.1 lipocalin family protein [Burkholderia plantarii]
MNRSLVRLAALTVAVAGAAMLLNGCGLIGGKRGNAAVPQPARPVDLDRYLGRWYEFARYENRFERDCDGVTADYARRADGLIDVVNACARDAHGAPRVSKGRAKPVADSDGAKLKVSFFGPFYIGDYWVLDHADDYSWSIVGEPSGRFLWLLTREAHPSTLLRQQLVARAAELGYDTSLLRMTAQ